MIFVDAGTVHAIWPGSILLETQQNCDMTYRMYDYGRPRELHIEKSLEATRLVTRAGKVAPRQLADRTVLHRCRVLPRGADSRVGSRTSAGLRGASEERGLAYLFAAAGAGRLTGEASSRSICPPRGIVAVPASSPEFADEDLGGLDLIRITPNWPRRGV